MTFEEAWAKTGRDYGEDALEQVRMGWDLAREWQPIETCPKELGKKYILYEGLGEPAVFLCVWSSQYEIDHCKDPWVTHWMECPELPEAK